MQALALALGLPLTPNKGGGVPFGGLVINGVPLTISGAYLVIGGNS
jgi:hypothetical protein